MGFLKQNKVTSNHRQDHETPGLWPGILIALSFWWWVQSSTEKGSKWSTNPVHNFWGPSFNIHGSPPTWCPDTGGWFVLFWSGVSMVERTTCTTFLDTASECNILWIIMRLLFWQFCDSMFCRGNVPAGRLPWCREENNCDLWDNSVYLTLNPMIMQSFLKQSRTSTKLHWFPIALLNHNLESSVEDFHCVSEPKCQNQLNSYDFHWCL